MALPSSQLARPYYRVAFQRLDDAKVLLEAGRMSGAVYLAGYSGECMLKAWIVEATPKSKRRRCSPSFKAESHTTTIGCEHNSGAVSRPLFHLGFTGVFWQSRNGMLHSGMTLSLLRVKKPRAF